MNWGRITFGKETFKWTYKNNNIIIQHSNRKLNIISIICKDDSLLQFVNNKLKKHDNEVISEIPPEFISKAIKKAIEYGSDSKNSIETLELEYK